MICKKRNNGRYIVMRENSAPFFLFMWNIGWFVNNKFQGWQILYLSILLWLIFPFIMFCGVSKNKRNYEEIWPPCKTTTREFKKWFPWFETTIWLILCYINNSFDFLLLNSLDSCEESRSKKIWSPCSNLFSLDTICLPFS